MEIKFTGENIGDIANQMTVMLIELELLQFPTDQVTEQVEDDREPGTGAVDKSEETDQPSRKADPEETPEKSEEEPAGEPEQEPEKDPAEAKKDAIEILMALYSDGKKDEVKALLEDFGVKKFGEVPDEKGVDLLSCANDLCKEPA